MNTQQQTTLATILSFVAGYLAARFTIFDASTWLSILTAVVGLGVTIWTAVVTRKTAMVNSVAAMPEVRTVELDKDIAGTPALDKATVSNVVSK